MKMNPPPETVEKLEAIYSELKVFFGQIQRQRDYGFKIFNSPPKMQAPVIFIGFQPGGRLTDWEYEKSRESHLRWPDEVEFAVADWPLARRMRAIFGRHINLRDTVGLNSIFLRSPNVKEYKQDMSDADRRKVQEFCNSKVCEIVDLLQPKKIVTLGFATLKQFGRTAPDLTGPSGRVVTQVGRVSEREAIASLHLTGSRISSSDFAAMSERLVEYVVHPPS